MATEKTTTVDDAEREGTTPHEDAEREGTTPHEEGDFGLSATRLQFDPAVPVDALLFDTLCLVRNALAVFESMSDGGSASELHYAGLYLLRQGSAP